MSAIGRVVTVSRPFGARAALVAMGVVVAAAPVVRAQPARPPACVAAPGAAQPVVDVHMHAVGAARAGPPADDTMALHAVIAELDRRHVIAVVVSSLALPRALQWAQRDARFVPTLAFRDTSLRDRADLGRRLVFGSDAAGPGAVTAGLAGIASAAFLRPAERRDILCDNAARFYRLDARARPPTARR